MGRLFSVVIDAIDHRAQARWWSATLETPVVEEQADVARIEPPRAPAIEFVPAAEPKTFKNRIHFDLATFSLPEHRALVATLITRGAIRLDFGPGVRDWVVLADPEGNEFCVVEPRPAYIYDGRLGTIMLETVHAEATAAFWATASGWREFAGGASGAIFRQRSGNGPWFIVGDTDDPKPAKNRIHLDVAPALDEDQASEVELLLAVGAHRVDIGQSDVSWVVLADPGDNELCVLTPR